MRKNTCSGWMEHPERAHVIDKNANGDAIGCHEANGRQSWHCLGCRFRDAGEMPKPRQL